MPGNPKFRLASPMRPVTEGHRVTPLELFFDLVFVYALTQVTAIMAADLSIVGLVQGLLVLALLWWCWCCYAWLSNTVRADEGITRIALFVVMATMFVVALTIPEAFDDLPGGISGPLVFASCYLIVRVLHQLIYWGAARGHARLRRQLLRAVAPMLGGATLLFVAGFLPDEQQGWRTGLWALALAVDYGGVMAIGAEGWEIFSAAHWAERHGLIIIVALGESIVAIGVGVAAFPVSWPIILASAFGVAISAAMWWAYFDTASIQAEHVLAGSDHARRSLLGRDGYTYLHFPMVAGIIGLSLGLKKVLEYVSDTEHHSLGDPLHGLGLYALYGGVVLYLLAHLAFKLRMLGSVNRPRLVAAVLLVALVPVADRLPALAALGVLTGVMVVLVLIEAVLFADDRRAARAGHQPA